MSKVKKQHYVPQFYLRQFANTDSQVEVYDKFNQKSFRANIRDVASSNYFYDISQNAIQELEKQLNEATGEGNVNQEISNTIRRKIKETQTLEEYLSRLEKRFAYVLDRILTGLDNRKRFKKKYRGDLALFLAVQFWRTEAQRQSMMELDQKLEERIMEIVRKMNEAKGTNFTAQDLNIKYDAEDTADQHRMLLFDNSNLLETANIFNNHIWIIGVNDTDNPFYTSDHPIARRAHKTDDWRSNTGIASPGIEIMFPLSPKYMLTMVDRLYFSLLESQDEKIIYLKKDHVIYKNCHQVYSSHRQIYSPKENFSLVERMLQENPHLKEVQSRWG